MSYLALRNLAVAQIDAALRPAFPKIAVKAHSGVFTEANIRQEGQRSPAVLTAFVRAADGVHANSVTFISWVLYRAEGDKLHDGALRIVSALVRAIRDADFALLIRETRTEAECVHTGKLDGIGATLWAVRWTLDLGGRALPLVGEPLEGLEDMGEAAGAMSVGSAEIEEHTEMGDS